MLSQLKDKVVNNKESSSISYRMRKRRFGQFLKLCNVTRNSTILDVGGCDYTWSDYPYRKNVTLLNLSFPDPGNNTGSPVHIRGDALNMEMFGENRFDVVFSNSVIEHVGTVDEQHQFALEIQRVGRSYWVQTPSRHFPIEPHFVFPFFQYLPMEVQKQIALRWRYSHYKEWKYDDRQILDQLELLNLLNREELLSLFNGASLYEEKLFGITKSFSIYKSTSRM